MRMGTAKFAPQEMQDYSLRVFPPPTLADLCRSSGAVIQPRVNRWRIRESSDVSSRFAQRLPTTLYR